MLRKSYGSSHNLAGVSARKGIAPAIKVIMAVCLTLLLGGPAMAPWAWGAADVITEKDTGRKFEYKIGAKFQVDAPHPGDVFVVRKPAFNSKVLKLVGRQDPPEPGKPGRVIFTFEAAGAGQTGIVINYFNPDDKEAPPVEILQVNIKIVR